MKESGISILNNKKPIKAVPVRHSEIKIPR
jgi:hypothetical protein